jgi:hypothetical protein
LQSVRETLLKAAADETATATLLVPFHRIPPPKESMKELVKNRRCDEHISSTGIRYGSCVIDGRIVVTAGSNNTYPTRIPLLACPF